MIITTDFLVEWNKDSDAKNRAGQQASNLNSWFSQIYEI